MGFTGDALTDCALLSDYSMDGHAEHRIHQILLSSSFVIKGPLSQSFFSCAE